ncbi:MAG: RNA ligase family protein [Nanoarchaeota archaeon]
MNSELEFIKYPEIPHLMENLEILDSDNLEVYEKLDGGNSQVRILDGIIRTGSRANFLNKEEHFRFDWFKDFNNWAKSNYSFYNLPENLIAYFEFLSPHTLKYKKEFENRAFLIDVCDLNPRKFIPYEVARQGLKELSIEGILFLEPLAKGNLNIDQAKKLAMGESQYSFCGREGIVIKDYHHQNFAKFWRTSADPSEKGLIEEINKTILSLQDTNPTITPGHLSSVVYQELKRSGRKEISLAEIKNTIERILNKI